MLCTIPQQCASLAGCSLHALHIGVLRRRRCQSHHHLRLPHDTEASPGTRISTSTGPSSCHTLHFRVLRDTLSRGNSHRGADTDHHQKRAASRNLTTNRTSLPMCFPAWPHMGWRAARNRYESSPSKAHEKLGLR